MTATDSIPHGAGTPAWNPHAMLQGEDAEKQEEPQNELRAFVVFRLGQQWLGVDVRHVREILNDMPVTPLPGAPHDVEGMVDVRGTGISVVDLGQHLGMHRSHDAGASRIIVFEFMGQGGETLPVGVRTEAVRDVCYLPDDAIEPAPETLGTWDKVAIEGVSRLEGEIVVVVNLTKILGADAHNDLFDFS